MLVGVIVKVTVRVIIRVRETEQMRRREKPEASQIVQKPCLYFTLMAIMWQITSRG